MSDTNFRTEIVGLARDLLAMYRSWRDSRRKLHPELPDVSIPPDCFVDFQKFYELPEGQRRDLLIRAMRTTSSILPSIDSADIIVPSLLVSVHEATLLLAWQDMEIDALRSRVEVLESREKERKHRDDSHG